MKIVINVPDYVKEQADDGKGEELGIPLWLAYEIANGTPLPEHHGRLIDADALTIKLKAWDINANGIPNYAWKCIREMLTIIEADKAESEDKCKNCKHYRNPDYTRCHECEADSGQV